MITRVTLGPVGEPTTLCWLGHFWVHILFRSGRLVDFFCRRVASDVEVLLVGDLDARVRSVV